MSKLKLKKEAVELRKQGKTYSEIQHALGKNISKSTLSSWCSKIKLQKNHQRRIKKIILSNAERARDVALVANRVKREKFLKSIIDRNKHIALSLKNKDTAKIALAMLYLSEGSKNKKSALMFGNSNPSIINLFLHLLRYCYNIDGSKFRCTLQCRADQDIKKLEEFWSRVTKIKLSQFYKARIDPRTIGKASINPNYKGVCRIDYFSADLSIELKQIAEIINKGI